MCAELNLSQLEILNTIDNPGHITLQVSYIPTHCRCLLVGKVLTITSKMIACSAFCDEEPVIHVEIAFISKFTGNEAGAPKLVSTTEFMDLLAVVGVAVCQARGKNGIGSCTINI